MKFLSEDKLVLLGYDLDNLLKVPEKMGILGEMFQKCITSDLHRHYSVRWLRLCSFSFHSWSDFHLPCPVHRSGQMRRLLDVVRCFVVFTCFATVKNNEDLGEMGRIFSSGSVLPLNNFWSWLHRIYSKVTKEEGSDTLTYVNIEHHHNPVIINGKQLNFKYLKNMKADLMNSFIDLVEDLHVHCTFGDVFEVYTQVMANRAIPVADSFEKFGSVFDVISEKDVIEFQMAMRNQINQTTRGDTQRVPTLTDENNLETTRIKKEILKLIGEITKIMMVSVWINPGLALRFPELSILSFAGESRNIYFDADDRVFIIRSRYNKNTKYDTRMLFLDRVVSAQLFWFMYILRPFVIRLLGSRVSAINTKEIIGMWKQPIASEEEVAPEGTEEKMEFNFRMQLHATELRRQLDSLRPTERGLGVMKTMLFVDVQNMSMIGYSGFTNTLMQYPRSVSLRESHKIKMLRQGLAAMWKHFAIPEYIESASMMEDGIAKGFGHGLTSSRTSYGVDSRRTTGDAALVITWRRSYVQYVSKRQIQFSRKRILGTLLMR